MSVLSMNEAIAKEVFGCSKRGEIWYHGDGNTMFPQNLNFGRVMPIPLFDQDPKEAATVYKKMTNTKHSALGTEFLKRLSQKSGLALNLNLASPQHICESAIESIFHCDLRP